MSKEPPRLDYWGNPSLFLFVCLCLVVINNCLFVVYICMLVVMYVYNVCLLISEWVCVYMCFDVVCEFMWSALLLLFVCAISCFSKVIHYVLECIVMRFKLYVLISVGMQANPKTVSVLVSYVCIVLISSCLRKTSHLGWTCIHAYMHMFFLT